MTTRENEQTNISLEESLDMSKTDKIQTLDNSYAEDYDTQIEVDENEHKESLIILSSSRLVSRRGRAVKIPNRFKDFVTY